MTFLIPEARLLPSFKLTVVTDTAGFDALEEEWRLLHGQMRMPTTPLKWEWMREWWRYFGSEYGRSPGGLSILTVRGNGKLVAILPLYIKAGYGLKPTTLRFISTGEDLNEITYPEYLDLLCSDESLEGSLEAIAETIFNDKTLAWDELHLGILSPNSHLYRLASSPLRKARAWVNESLHVSLKADIGRGIEEYLELLSSTAKRHFRRVLKQRGDPGLNFSVADEESSAQTYFTELIRLHDKRWSNTERGGAFQSERVIGFHKSLISKLLPRKEVVLAKLERYGTPVAVIYGFVNRGRFDFYQCGIDVSRKDIKSPGTLAHLLTMEFLAKRSVSTYDLLVGNDRYKMRMSTSKTFASEISVLRPTIRSAVKVTRHVLNRANVKLWEKIHYNGDRLL